MSDQVREDKGAEWCRNWLAETDNRCGKPAKYIVWGKLFPPDYLGPRCEDCAYDQVGYHALRPDSGYAIYKLPAPLVEDGQEGLLEAVGDIEEELEALGNTFGEGGSDDRWLLHYHALRAKVAALRPALTTPQSVTPEAASKRWEEGDGALPTASDASLEEWCTRWEGWALATETRAVASERRERSAKAELNSLTAALKGEIERIERLVQDKQRAVAAGGIPNHIEANEAAQGALESCAESLRALLDQHTSNERER